MNHLRHWKLVGIAILLVAIGYYLRPAGAAADAPVKPEAKKNTFVTFAEDYPLHGLNAATDTILNIGDKLPKVACADFDGKAIDFDSLYGDKATLIVCWSTWCGPCMQQLPHEVQLSRAYSKLGLKVIGVNADKDPKRAQAAASALAMNWPTIYEPSGSERPTGIVKTLGVKSWPTLLLLDADRKLIAASPHLTSSTIIGIGASDMYAVHILDLALTKVLGPLPGIQFISPTP